MIQAATIPSGPIAVKMSRRVKDITGQRFGRLVVERFVGCSKGGESAMWLCRCDCGSERVIDGSSLRSGATKSCGCYHSDRVAQSSRRHGLCESPEYRAWKNMRKRCAATNGPDFAHYKSRGITVCQRWAESFAAFYQDVGARPSPLHSLDRIDNNGHYEPGNVRWALRATQQRNRGANRLLTLNGTTMCVAEWAERLGLNRATLFKRLRNGWSVSDALTRPVVKQGERQ